ncbi:hypothetical protein MSAN_01704500 [Mycena sanguinolenta]|uniref:Uncharacterized protein n=1 Tax=Mycena sanguinolenta TaxID=230812 RepID=A0A8H6XWZ3_9AGAR|nr:hypothetical protein MSAN_01704500 [Mycena sanguinolenta]
MGVPSGLAEHFLATDGALPELQSLCVLWRERPWILDLPSLCASLARITAKLDVHPHAPTLALNIDVREGFRDVEASMSPEFIMREDIAAGCARVKNLTIHLDVKARHAWVVARLVALFPRTESLSLLTGGMAMHESIIATLLQAVKPTRWLKELKFNGKSRSLSE